jgi:hypothetical protein
MLAKIAPIVIGSMLVDFEFQAAKNLKTLNNLEDN